jgi:hypothetical protein
MPAEPEPSYTGRVTVTLDLSPDVLARLEAEAQRRGVGIEAVVEELARTLPGDRPAQKRPLSFIGLGASTDGRSARDVDEMLAEGFGQD